MAVVIATANILLFFVGQYFVTKRHLGGFLVWGISNLMVALFNLARGDSCMACLFVVYGLANSYSLFVWARKDRRRKLRGAAAPGG